MQIRQITHAVSFEDRMAHEAERARAQAQTMPPGKDRDALTERARWRRRTESFSNSQTDLDAALMKDQHQTIVMN
jgi:hypothetical protein